MNRSTSALLLAVALGLSACAGYAPPANGGARMADGVLTGPNGMTLYVFDKDTPDSQSSACNGACASNWPPLLATANDRATAPYSIILRTDGRRQWAFRGKPLYYWTRDQQPGDQSGDGFNKLWHVARP